jgi:hypothetical protein
VPNSDGNNFGGSGGGGGGAGGNGGPGGDGYLFGSDGATGNTGSAGSSGSSGDAAGPSREEGGALTGATSETFHTNLTYVENRAHDLHGTVRGFGEINNTLVFRNFENETFPDPSPSGSFTYGGAFLTTDPSFVRNPDSGDGDWETTADNDYGDLRLLLGSPALDVGDNTFNAQALDLAGGPRIVDSVIDLGAYEGAYHLFDTLYPGLDPLADSNGNGLSNFVDYAIGNDPNTPGGLPPTAQFDGEFYTYPLRPRSLDVGIVHTMSDDLQSFTPMIEGEDYEDLGGGQIRILLPPQDRLFLRHSIQPATP